MISGFPPETQASHYPHETHKPCILLTNDDGVNSEGLWAAYEALSELGEVIVCAPATQQSAVGRSLSIFEPLRVNTVKRGHVTAYAVGGKPTDSVILALFALGVKPDIVVSGINIGENVSYEAITTSGTVGAALEAANHGYPSVAFSLQIEDQKEKFDDARHLADRFLESKGVVKDIILRVLEKGFPTFTHVINVNIPSVITGEYEIPHLAEHLFVTGVEKRLDPRGKPYYWINGPLITDAPEGTDVHSIHKGNISITPITLDCTAYSGSDELKKLFL
ncbi:5'/3'-nucleotidase SurE [Methanospirillum stamsii]|uniref:5'-nucleotidase SurE n=1 Tax=Methanospirillum stamsii TaxID=1277351 RepID=A0A2V2N4H8_9EURY|nr:5'/3'-nucleotidase SurE [Methanospirillum stamsii]PWR75004.1 5'/3'-nucleotidase SurE [Methanospirillum stamsii]